MNVEKNFLIHKYESPELRICSYKVKDKKNSRFIDFTDLGYFIIVYISKGEFGFIHSGKHESLKSGDIFIAKPYENFSIITEDNEPQRFIFIISVHQNYFSEVKGDENFLRAFLNRKNGELNVYKQEKLKKYDICDKIFPFFDRCINKNLGEVHFSALIITLITVISLIYDENNFTPSSKYSEEYEVLIWDYILSNALTNLSAKDVEKKFAISKWYLDKVTNRFYGEPFHKTLTNLRMWHSRQLMQKNLSCQEISRLCGYNNYSSFYRCYQRFFKSTPKDDYSYFQKNGIFPFNTNNN
ncbi:MAG: helix-turn-helix domain-containing protein [Acutalibacteraceae bacterium]